jgi:hypothetical protein
MFAHEERDGVVYQLVPMAADRNYGLGFQNYRESDPYTIRVLPNTGHLRVTVAGRLATVDYVRAFLPGEGNNGQVPYSYTISGVTPGTPETPPPGGPPTNPPDALSITAAANNNGMVTATWRGNASPSAGDWLGLYAAGTDDSQYLLWFYTSCSMQPVSAAVSGSCTFGAPEALPDGWYEVRLFANDDWVRLASSASFVLSRRGQPVLTTTPLALESGGQITARWTGVTAPSPTDWLSISVPSAPDGHYIEWVYTSCTTAPAAALASGSCNVTLPSLPSGTYEFRLYADDGFVRLATGPPFKVTP